MSNSFQPHELWPPGSSVHGILQARKLEWVAIPFSRGYSQTRDGTQVSCTAGSFLTLSHLHLIGPQMSFISLLQWSIPTVLRALFYCCLGKRNVLQLHVLISGTSLRLVLFWSQVPGPGPSSCEELVTRYKHGCQAPTPGGWEYSRCGRGQTCQRSCTSLSPCLFNLYAEYLIQDTWLDEAQAGIKIARRNINNLRYADDTTLMAESEEELKSLLMKVKRSVKKVS